MTDAEALDLIPFVRQSYNTKNFTKDSYTAQRWFSTVEDSLKRKAVRIGRNLYDTPTLFWCSECGWSTGDTYPADRFNYCPMCGAKME